MKPIISFVAMILGSSAFAQNYTPQLTISQAVLTGGLSEQKATQTLLARNAISSGATALYTAGQSVTLQPGFVAQAGSVFRATVELVATLGGAGDELGLLVRAYPNPFVGQTTIEYSSPLAGTALHTLTDATGQIVHQSQDQAGPSAGVHQLQFDGRTLPAGVYLYQVQVGSQVRTVRLLKKP